MEPPAMSAAEIAQHPHASVRVNCYECQRCLYAGDELPDGDVIEAAGCNDDPRTCPGQNTDPETPVAAAAPPATLLPVADVIDSAAVSADTSSVSQLAGKVNRVQAAMLRDVTRNP